MKPFARNFSWSLAATFLSLGLAAAGGRAWADEKAGPKIKEPAATEESGAAGEENAEPPRIQGLEMLPAGKTNLGVRLPVFEGSKQTMLLKAAEMTPKDKDELDMKGVEIRILNDEGAEDTKIVMASSRYLVTHGLLSSDEETVVHGLDYTITGDTMDFDAKKKYGIMRGHVKMVIRNFQKYKEDEKGGEVLKGKEGSKGAEPAATEKPATEKTNETIPQERAKP